MISPQDDAPAARHQREDTQLSCNEENVKYPIAAVLLSISTYSFAGQAPDGSACKVGDKIGMIDGSGHCVIRPNTEPTKNVEKDRMYVRPQSNCSLRGTNPNGTCK
jgi:hypothetical protein